MTVALSSFLSGPRLVYRIPSTPRELSGWCTQRVPNKDMESVFLLRKWRTDGLLSTPDGAAFAHLRCVLFLPQSHLQLTVAETRSALSLCPSY